MEQTTLLVASAGAHSERAAAYVGRALRAWPAARMPAVRRVGFAQLSALLGRGDCDAGAAIVFFGRSDAEDHIDRCVQDLHAASVPALVLTHECERWAPLGSHGVILLPWGTRPGAAGAMLYALADRQALVRSLLREIAIAHRCQAGVRAEVERIHEELHLAAGIQHEFTAAPLPTVAGVDMGVLYRPVNAVSGDTYSVRAIDDRRLIFFVADAVGHGVPAALLTMILTSSLSGFDARGLDRPLPAQVLERLNRRMVEGSMGTGRFATAICGTLDSATGELAIAGAGHPAPIVFGAGGGRAMETEGPLLGVFPDADFTQATTVLQPGESLLIYTDGLEACFPRPRPGAKYPHIDAVTGLFRGRGERGAAEVVGELEALIDEQHGSLHQADDITALLMTKRPAAAGLRRAA